MRSSPVDIYRDTVDAKSIEWGSMALKYFYEKHVLSPDRLMVNMELCYLAFAIFACLQTATVNVTQNSVVVGLTILPLFYLLFRIVETINHRNKTPKEWTMERYRKFRLMAEIERVSNDGLFYRFITLLGAAGWTLAFCRHTASNIEVSVISDFMLALGFFFLHCFILLRACDPPPPGSDGTIVHRKTYKSYWADEEFLPTPG